MQALDKFINEVKTLPPAQPVLSELIVALNEDDTPAARVVDLIAVDPALTAKVLQRCNAAAFGLNHPVVDLPEGVTQLGFDTIFRLVTVVIGEGLLNAEQPGYGIGLGGLWEHSVATAVASRVIARDLGGNENLAFTAGLLHDIGKLVLGVFLEGSMPALLANIRRSGLTFLEAEQSILGVQHAEVGGRVLARWNFPENFVSAVSHHHNPAQARPHQQLAAYVHLGNTIAHYLGRAQGFDSFVMNPEADALEILELTPAEMATLVAETDAALEQFNMLLQGTS